MSHEIRTPMTAILGYSELLADLEDLPGPATEYLTTIRQNGDHLLTLINDILDLSKIESGKMDVEKIPVSLWEVFDGVILLMKERAASAGIYLEMEYNYPLPSTIISDPVRIRQILVNLVGNAIKFTSDGGVTIRLYHTSVAGKNQIKFDVKDTGIGLSNEQIKRLFVPFSQADASTTRNFGGTGLGLTISRYLTEALNGKISISSVEGEGSTFSVEFDPGDLSEADWLKQHPKPEAQAKPAPDKPSQHFEGGSILLVEDNPVNQKLATRILNKAGYDVDQAANGQIALDMVNNSNNNGEPYCLILMDMQMPVMDGYQATKRLRADGCMIPIVALTANAMGGDREKCLAAGCTEFDTKPYNRKGLVAKIACCIEQSTVPL